jgi:hypothetical protein
MSKTIEPKFKVGDKVYVTFCGSVNNLFYESEPLTIKKVDYDHIYPLYFFEEKRGFALKEKDLTAFNEVISKLEEHIEQCLTLLRKFKREA